MEKVTTLVKFENRLKAFSDGSSMKRHRRLHIEDIHLMQVNENIQNPGLMNQQ